MLKRYGGSSQIKHSLLSKRMSLTSSSSTANPLFDSRLLSVWLPETLQGQLLQGSTASPPSKAGWRHSKSRLIHILSWMTQTTQSLEAVSSDRNRASFTSESAGSVAADRKNVANISFTGCNRRHVHTKPVCFYKAWPAVVCCNSSIVSEWDSIFHSWGKHQIHMFFSPDGFAVVLSTRIHQKETSNQIFHVNSIKYKHWVLVLQEMFCSGRTKHKNSQAPHPLLALECGGVTIMV